MFQLFQLFKYIYIYNFALLFQRSAQNCYTRSGDDKSEANYYLHDGVSIERSEMATEGSLEYILFVRRLKIKSLSIL